VKEHAAEHNIMFLWHYTFFIHLLQLVMNIYQCDLLPVQKLNHSVYFNIWSCLE